MLIVVWLLIGAVCAVIGAKMAASRNRDGVTWALICFLFGVVGIVLLAAMGEGTGSAGVAAPVLRRWEALKEVDEDIAPAADKALAVSPECERQLAEKYLALDDKKYLRPLLKKVLEQFKEQEAMVDDVDEEAIERARLEIELSALRRN